MVGGVGFLAGGVGVLGRWGWDFWSVGLGLLVGCVGICWSVGLEFWVGGVGILVNEIVVFCSWV